LLTDQTPNKTNDLETALKAPSHD